MKKKKKKKANWLEGCSFSQRLKMSQDSQMGSKSKAISLLTRKKKIHSSEIPPKYASVIVLLLCLVQL